MNFKLESWEIPPGANADNLSVPIEFGPVDWNGAPTMISARWLELASGEAMAFFHPHASDINYVVASDGNNYHLEPKKINSKRLGEIVRDALEISDGWRESRLFHCANAGLILYLGHAYWVDCEDFWQQEAPMSVPFDTRIEFSSRIYNWIQTQWEDTNSELRFSWEWNHKTEDEKIDWLGTVAPRWNELHELLRAVSFVVNLPPSERWILDHVDTHYHSRDLWEQLQPWRELLNAHFSFEPLPESYPQFLREYFRYASSHIQIVGAESTAHEQLEDKLYLRDWLQHNAPDHLDLVQ